MKTKRRGSLWASISLRDVGCTVFSVPRAAVEVDHGRVQLPIAARSGLVLTTA